MLNQTYYPSPDGDGYILEINSRKHGILKALFSKEDLEFVISKRWYVGKFYNTFYVIDGKSRLHTYLMNPIRNKQVVDHINRNGLDNRRSNLRICSFSENAMNITTQKGKLYKGINYRTTGIKYKENPKYVVRIIVNKKEHAIGSFTTLKEAILEYNRASEKYHGIFGIKHEVPND